MDVRPRMMSQGDTWQVYNCGSSNWTTGDIFMDQSLCLQADKLVMRSSRDWDSHTPCFCQLLLVTQTVVSRQAVGGSRCYSCPPAPPPQMPQTVILLLCSGAGKLSESNQGKNIIVKTKVHGHTKLLNRPLGFCRVALLLIGAESTSVRNPVLGKALA